MICPACQTSDAATRATLAVVHLILSWELPRESFLLDGNLIGLEKPDGGVRPTAINETWFRFAGICALRTRGSDIGAGLAPLQVGFCTKGGTETIMLALAAALIEGLVVFAVDMKNAYKSITLAAMVVAAPAYLPVGQWAYAEATSRRVVGPPEGTAPFQTECGCSEAAHSGHCSSP